ncbi:hypothetical protein [Neobacillus rhizophilus]|uniref:Uncharacterized protein n=1 Tax=Neobacillus rhizophilus TaxID=2833579 RepID=A0A942U4Y1_9BACI|nr:hypothetical protein [Neobacillus rhizophilus]MBS4214780.1 hypothetical protein [Neobacillus rhizophilus]
MKKLTLLSLICIMFLTALEKPSKVVPFLRPIVSGLAEHTNVPVLLPAYWKGQKAKKHTSVIVNAYENGYMIYFVSTDKPYRANDPAIYHPPESKRVGELSGNVGTMIPSDRLSGLVFYKKKDGAKLWIQPWIRSVIYAKRGPWSMHFDGDNGDEPYQQAVDLFKAMKKVNWLKNKDIHEGYISVIGTRLDAYTNIAWDTGDGFVYNFFYKGPIKNAVKIVDSLQYVEYKP